MNKIPVGKTVAFAYNFLFTRFGTVAAVAGLPAVLASAVDYLVRSYSSTDETEATAGTNLLIWLLGTVTTIFISSVATVGITRAALGLPLGPAHTIFRRPARAAHVHRQAALLARRRGAPHPASLVASVSFMLAGVPLDGAGTVEPSAATSLPSRHLWGLRLGDRHHLRMGFLLSATSYPGQGGLSAATISPGNSGASLRFFLLLPHRSWFGVGCQPRHPQRGAGTGLRAGAGTGSMLD